MSDRSRLILRRASCATASSGVLAFWAGMVMAARRYPSEYDWRYMPISHLLSPVRDPAAYLWAWTGIVLFSVCGLWWTALVARRDHEGTEKLPGIKALQFGYVLTICAAVMPPWLLRIERGHEILAVLAFAGLSFGIARMMFRTIERTLRGRKRRLSGHARLQGAILASAAVFPIVLAALAQAYVHFALPELHWVNLSWRAAGVPLYLSFDFWEWITCAVISAYMVILSLASHEACPTEKAEKEQN